MFKKRTKKQTDGSNSSSRLVDPASYSEPLPEPIKATKPQPKSKKLSLDELRELYGTTNGTSGTTGTTTGTTSGQTCEDLEWEAHLLSRTDHQNEMRKVSNDEKLPRIEDAQQRLDARIADLETKSEELALYIDMVDQALSK